MDAADGRVDRIGKFFETRPLVRGPVVEAHIAGENTQAAYVSNTKQNTRKRRDGMGSLLTLTFRTRLTILRSVGTHNSQVW